MLKFENKLEMKRILRFSTVLVTAFVLVSCGDKSASGFPDWALVGFQRPEGVNPVISPDTASKFLCPMREEMVGWEESDTFSPTAVSVDGKIVVLYRAEDNSAKGIGSRTSRIGYAVSDDGFHFEKRSEPVLFPGGDDQTEYEIPGGCEDPRVAVTEDGTYVLTYTQWNRSVARLAVATSRDLIHWEKHGPVFDESEGIVFDSVTRPGWTKSGSIVTKVDKGRQVIAKVNGKYLMYWGEKYVNLATSDDLIHWTPMLDEKGGLLQVLAPREGYFDSVLTECGPPAIITKKGILLMYNGKNARGDAGDRDYPGSVYCGGQALFDINDPTRLIGRLDKPFFFPEADFEKTGQYSSGNVFLVGLVPHRKHWYLYYGCADSYSAVAVR